MPAKGKHHHLSHHHNQPQQQAQQQQHLVNINQSGISGTSQSYNAGVAARGYVSHASSDFHVSGQNYGAQPGGQVGGGASSLGVSGGRGPPTLSGIQSIGQTTPGLQSGGPAGAQQPSAPTPVSGVQQQQPQGPAPTTTPPVHTPSPQEMGKQIHHPSQSTSLQQPYVTNQSRAVPQGFYPMATRQVQSRNSGHRNSQGSGAPHVVSMSGVAGGAGQPPALYSHHANINVSGTSMLVPSQVPSQVPSIHTGHHTAMYPVNNQMQQLAFSQHRHQTHQSQQFFTGFPTHAALIPPNLFSYTSPQFSPYCFPTHHPQSNPMNLTRTSSNAVSGGGQHVGPLAGAQGTVGVPQGTLQQQSQQPQTIPPMAISLAQTAYTGHNTGALNSLNTYQKLTARPCALMDIVDPNTGKNIAEDFYRNAAASPGEDSNSRETPQPQDSAIVAEFASRVAKAASEDSESNSNSSTSNVYNNNNQQSSTQPSLNNQSIRNSKTQSNPNKDPIITQCNTNSSVPMQTTTNSVSSPLIESSNSVTPSTDFTPVKSESKPFLPQSNEVWTQNEDQKQPIVEETVSLSSSSNSIKDHNINIQSASLSTSSSSTPDTESKNASITGSQAANVTIESSNSANGSPVQFSNRDRTQNAKTSSNSPPRRKPHNYHQQQQPQQQSSNLVPAINNSSVPEVSATNKDSKDKKTNDKTLNTPNKEASPVLTNQNEQPQLDHQKSNGEGIEEKSEIEAGAKHDAQQKSADSKSTQKQKSKNKIKNRDINRKGAEKEGTDMDAFVNPTSQPIKLEGKEPSLSKTGQNVDQQQNPQQSIVKEISIEEKETNLEKPEPVTLNQQEQLVKSLSGETIFSSSNEMPIKDDTTPVENSLTDETVASEVEELDKKITKDSIIEDSNKNSNLLDKKNNDVVDHAIVNDADDVEAIVVQKNEENTKVSANLRRAGETNSVDVSVIDKQNENELSNKMDTAPKTTAPRLQLNYGPYQWSPTNTDGKKEYDREFLMKLQDDPRCKIRPVNLPDLEVVLKDGSRQISRNNSVGLRMFKDTRAHEQFFPEFSKSSFNAKLPPPMNKKSYQGKSKVIKPNVIHVTLSLREDVKLRETENAWRPSHLKSQSTAEEDQKTQILYKKVRSILNKLTPQKFNTLVNQMKELEIDTQEKLEGVIKLVFEKAIDEPNFSEAYASMCQEIGNIKILPSVRISPDDSKNYLSFRQILLIRCQAEFLKNSVDENERAKKVKEIEQCTEPEKKKELQTMLDEEDRLIRVKSVGNIRFIGELYKRGMLKSHIMKGCIDGLLQSIDEENLECLCKLLTTIGKLYEKNNSLADDFRQLKELVSSKNKKISSRVRFMIQDVIDLRKNNWIPRRDESNPKTIDQIQKEAESERIELPPNNPPMNTPRRGDERNNDRRRNRPSMDDGTWSTAGGKMRQQPYTVEMSKLSTKPPAMDEIKLGSRNAYVWNVGAQPGKNMLNNNKFAVLDSVGADQDNRSSSILSGSRSTGPREYRTDTYKPPTWTGDSRGSRNGNYQMGNSSNLSRENSVMEGSRSQSISMPPPSEKNKPLTVSSGVPPRNAPVSNRPIKSDEELEAIIKSLLDGCKSIVDARAFVTYAMDKIRDDFNPSTYPLFVRTSINSVLDRSAVVRQRFSILLAHMITKNYITLSLFQSEYEKIIEFADELVIDIPMVWSYFAEILSELMVANAHPFNELKRTLEILKTAGTSGKLIGELFKKLAKDQGPKWILDRWDQSGLQWSDLLHPDEKIDDILSQYQLEFLINGCCNSEMPTTEKQVPLTERIDDIHSHLLRLLRECRFDDVTSWIAANVGQQSKEELFIKTLVTTILEVTIEPSGKSYKFLTEAFQQLLPLLTRYIDTEPQLELQCLIALEIHDFKLDHPQGILNSIINILYESGTISDDAFLAWQNHVDSTTFHSHPIAVTNLGTFLRSLQERSDSSEES